MSLSPLDRMDLRSVISKYGENVFFQALSVSASASVHHRPDDSWIKRAHELPHDAVSTARKVSSALENAA